MSVENTLNNNTENSITNNIDENKDKIIEFKSSDFQDKNITKNFAKEVFILTKKDYEISKIFKGKHNIDNNNDWPNGQTQMGFIQKIKIISSIEEVENLIKNNNEFFLLNKEHFKEMNNIQEVNKGESAIFFESDNKKYLIFPKEKGKNNVLEISNGNIYNLEDISNINEFNNYTNNKNKDNQNKFPETKEMILKKIILLYAFEKHFIQILNSPIEDEYDINEYYLINKNWIKNYKNYIYYQMIIKILDEMNLTFSYKGYCINLDEILNKIINNNKISSYINNIETFHNNFNDYLSKEDNFMSQMNENRDELKDIIKFPIDFILVPENLFDLFFKEIKVTKYSKEDYKFNTLIGDKVLFIQSKQNNSMFYIYFLSANNDNLEISFIFRYLEKTTFFNEVKEYIKGKGFINYFIKRKLKNDPSPNFYEIKKGEVLIGDYKIYQPIDLKLIKEFKKNNPLNKCKEIYEFYKTFISKLFTLKDNKITISSSIIDIKKFDYISTFIVLQSDFQKYEKKLLFKEMEDLSKIKDKEQYDAYEKKIDLTSILNLFLKLLKNIFIYKETKKTKILSIK